MIKLTNQGRLKLFELGLSKTQVVVCEKMFNHDSQQEVADSLFVGVKSVKFHLSKIYKKMDVSGVQGLLVKLFPLCAVEIIAKKSEPIKNVIEGKTEILPEGMKV